MKTLNKSVDYQINTIAIVDNDGASGPEMMLPYWEVQMAGFTIIHVPRNLQAIPEYLNFIQKHAQAVICSHRLGTYQQPLPFSGAELAAALYHDECRGRILLGPLLSQLRRGTRAAMR